MTWTNFHTHTGYCDGEGMPEDYVTAAIELRMSSLGFSGHAPLPFDNDWTMKWSDLPDYIQKINYLKGAYADRLNIFLGLEIDYIPGVISPKDSEFRSLNLDYTIGSIHYLDKDENDFRLPVDAEAGLFEKGLSSIYRGDIKRAVSVYYRNLRDMVVDCTPDIVGHLDIIKKNNDGYKYYSESADWYRREVLKTLEAISQSEVILEVNNGGITRGKTDSLYPSRWILEECLELGIPLTLSSDAHSPEDLTAGFPETAHILESIGFDRLYVLTQSGWNPFGYSSQGIYISV